MNKTLSVSAIQDGTVIDHIAAGQALRIINLLRLLDKNLKATVGLNLPSKQFKYKDLIKIEDYILNSQEVSDIAIFAPNATVNIIKNFAVVEKIATSLPNHIATIFACPNKVCITQTEPVDTFFHIDKQGNQVKLVCKFCEKTFDRDDVKVKI